MIKNIGIILVVSFAFNISGISQVNLNRPRSKNQKFTKNKVNPTLKENETSDTKTKAGVELENSPAYYYKSYNKYITKANEQVSEKEWSSALSSLESAGMALSKVQQKSEKELDLNLELEEIKSLEDIANGSETTAKTEIKEDRARRSSEAESKEKIRKDINAKYDPIKYELRKLKYFLGSSSGGYSDFLEALIYLDENKLTMSSIKAMLNDPSEVASMKEIGRASSRDEIKDDILPGITNALEKNGEGDYSFKKLDSKLSKMGEYATIAKTGNSLAADNAKKVKEIYGGVVLFKKFVNNHSGLDAYYKKADYYYQSVKKTLDEKYAQYRAGDFHRANGSGIYIVQQDGITASALNKNVVTDKIVIDGKKPVHIFVLTDNALETYGSFLQFDLVDGDRNPNQNKYVFDAKKAVPLDPSEKQLGYKKLVFVPSADWKDLKDTYAKSMFYDCGTQRILANTLVSGVPQEFTIYSADNSLKKTISIEATEEGLQFLKDMKAKMEKYEIDAARMEKAEVSNPALEKSIASGFISNSNGAVKEVVKVVITSKPWYIKKNALGVPLYKDFYAHVAFKKADGVYYIQKVRCKKAYSGGNYEPMKVYGSGGSRKIRKENINK